MEKQSDLDQTPQIKTVLKALNHANRRDILMYLNDLRREVSFSELMDYLNIDSKSSSQFSYHLKLLLDASLLIKNNEKYSISPLGIKATSMLDLVDTAEPENKSMAQKVSDSYKDLSTMDHLFLSFTSIGFILFFVPFSLMMVHLQDLLFWIFPTIFGAIALVLIFYYAYRKLNYLPSVLVLTNVVWIVFLPKNQLKFGIIYLSSVLGVIWLYNFLLDFFSNSRANSFNLILSALAFILSAIVIYTIFSEEKVLNKNIH